MTKSRKKKRWQEGGRRPRAVATPAVTEPAVVAQPQPHAPAPPPQPAAPPPPPDRVASPALPATLEPQPPQSPPVPLPDATSLGARLALTSVFTTKPWRVLGWLAMASALTYLLPPLARFRPLRAGELSEGLRAKVSMLVWRDDVGTLDRPPVHAPNLFADVEGQAARNAVEPSSPKGSAAAADEGPPVRDYGHIPAAPVGGGAEIEDPSGSLSHFYSSLANTRALVPGAVTRIVHLGDSPIVGDLISGGARARLQREFGDSGHGWTLPARPWDWYAHDDVSLSASGWRARSVLFGNGGTGRCGLNGVFFSSSSPSAVSRIGTAKKGPGSAASHLLVYFDADSAGGTLTASVDGAEALDISTKAMARTCAVRDMIVSDGPHALTLRPKGDGPVSLYGVALERDAPGVIYDSVGASGGTVHFLDLLDEEDWEESLRLRKPDLVILNYGTNESGYEGLGMKTYAAQYRELIRRVRTAVPEASVLIMAPMDRGGRGASGQIVTMEMIPKIVETQRAVAAETGCAFFNTYEAMGGEGTMARWYARESGLVTGDLTHPTGTGANVISKLLVDALERGFAGHGGQGGGAEAGK